MIQPFIFQILYIFRAFPGKCLTLKTLRVSVAKHQDPPKKGVAEAVVDAQKAGVKARIAIFGTGLNRREL